MVARHAPGQSILFPPDIRWTAPSELPSLRGVKRIGFDTETCDPDLDTLGPGTRRGGYIVGLCVAAEDRGSWYLPIRHQGGGNLDSGMVLRWAREELNAFDGTVVGANLGYDLDFAANDGITFPNVKRFHDVQIAEPLLDEHKLGYSLDALATEYLGEHKVEEVLREAATAYGFGATNKSIKQNLWRLHAGYVGAYGEGDALQPLEIMDKQLKKLEELDLLKLFDLESRLLPILVAMRRRGVRVDVAGAHQVRAKLVIERDAALARVRRLAGPKAELMAPDSFAQALVDRGLVVGRTPKSGQYSITKGWMQANAGDELVDAIQAGRRVNTVITTFIDGHVFNHAINGRIHCQYKQLKDDDGGTGARFSSSNPNLQNLSARDEVLAPLVRGLFLPDEGEEWELQDQCLTGDTRVVTIDGIRTMRELADNPVPVLSSKDCLSVEFREVTIARKIGMKQVFKITLKNGATVRCTENHRWKGFNNEDIFTRDLITGMRLAHVHDGKPSGRGYAPTWYLRSNRNYFVKHRLVAFHAYGPCPEGKEVDHRDHDHSHWWRSNLRYWEIEKNRGEAAQRWWDQATDEQREQKKESLKKGLKESGVSFAGEKNPNYGKKRPGIGGRPRLGHHVACVICAKNFYTKRTAKATLCSLTCKGIASQRGTEASCLVCDVTFYRSRTSTKKTCSLVCRGIECSRQRAHEKEKRELSRKEHKTNHQIVSVEPDGIDEVYDLTVDGTRTYVLENGLISHNSQMEYRLQVHYARGTGAKEARQQYNDDPSTDFHKFCAVLLNADPNDDILRKKIKNTNFAKSYGALAPKLALTFGCSVEEAQAFVTLYEEKLPFTKTTFDACQAVASQRGFIRSILGRYARFPLWEPADNSRQKTAFRKKALPREAAEIAYGDRLVRAGTYKALNNLLQFGNADYTKKSMCDIWEAGLCEPDALGPFLLQVHDELDYSVPKTLRGEEAIKNAKHLMETAIELRVPVLVKAKRGETWGACG